MAAAAAYGFIERPARLPGGWRGYGLALFLGIAPDLDVLARIALGVGNHRGPTHSIAAALSLALVCAIAVCARRPRDLPRAWAGLSLVGLTHPVLDWLMACGPGVPFLWPWSGQGWLCPVQLVPTAYYSKSVAGLLGMLNHTPSWRAVGLEVLIFGPLLALGVLRQRMRRPLGKAVFALICLTASAAGVTATWMLYN